MCGAFFDNTCHNQTCDLSLSGLELETETEPEQLCRKTLIGLEALLPERTLS